MPNPNHPSPTVLLDQAISELQLDKETLEALREQRQVMAGKIAQLLAANSHVRGLDPVQFVRNHLERRISSMANEQEYAKYIQLVELAVGFAPVTIIEYFSPEYAKLRVRFGQIRKAGYTLGSVIEREEGKAGWVQYRIIKFNSSLTVDAERIDGTSRLGSLNISSFRLVGRGRRRRGHGD